MRGARSLVAVAAGLVLAAPAAAADKPIAFANYAYDPPDATIKTGDTATFSGAFMSHPLVWDHGEFATTVTGSSKPFSFSQPGTYAYHCQIHGQSEGMVGVVRVVADQHPARVAFGVTPASPGIGQPVTFAYSGDPDPDGMLVSWQWDLDGDGSFETSTAAPTATHTYASAATLTVRMRAVDDSNEPSATAEQAITIGAPGAGGGASGSRDTTAPRATLLKLRGLRLSFRSSERASATATLRARGKTVARGSAGARSRAIAIRLRLTSAGRSLLPRGHRLRARLTLTLRDASGNRRTVRRTVTVRRS
jgi:plastocyanin